MNETRTIHFMLVNTNPLDISVDQIISTLPKTTIQLVHMQTLNGSETTITYQISHRKSDVYKVYLNISKHIFEKLGFFKFIQLAIPAHHRAIFSLTINGSNDPSFYHETITFKTRYEVKIKLNFYDLF